jgi:hypothetical protein
MLLTRVFEADVLGTSTPGIPIEDGANRGEVRAVDGADGVRDVDGSGITEVVGVVVAPPGCTRGE